MEASGPLPAQLLWLLAWFKVIQVRGKAKKCRRAAFFKEAQLVAAIREKTNLLFSPLGGAKRSIWEGGSEARP